MSKIWDKVDEEEEKRAEEVEAKLSPEQKRISLKNIQEKQKELEKNYRILNIERLLGFNRIKFEYILVAIVFALFSLFVIGYYMAPQLILVMVILGAALFLPIGMFFSVFINTDIRVKLIRKISGKNYGYIKLVAGKSIRKLVKNLDFDVIKYGPRVFMIEQGRIYDEKEPDSYQKIERKHIQFEEGLPTIYFDVNDILPLSFHSIPGNDVESFRLPEHAGATLNKEIALEKAKAMNAVKRTMNILLVVLIGMMCLAMYFSYQTYTQMGLWQSHGIPIEAQSLANALIAIRNGEINTTTTTTTVPSNITGTVIP